MLPVYQKAKHLGQKKIMTPLTTIPLRVTLHPHYHLYKKAASSEIY